MARAKLSPADVAILRASVARGEAVGAAARRLGLAASALRKAALGLTHKDVPGALDGLRPAGRPSLLTPGDLEAMRAMRAAGDRLAWIADLFGISEQHASRVCRSVRR